MNHSPIGPSSAKRILQCPGSVDLIASLNLPPQPQSKYAEEGTKAHEVVEKILTQQVAPEWATEEMLEGAQQFLALLEEDLDDCSVIQVPLQTERKVHASSISPQAWGTCDAFFIADNTIYCYDYKFGKGVIVDVEDNSQLLYYCAGILDSIAVPQGLSIRNIEIRICQPRVRQPQKQRLHISAVTDFVDSMLLALESKKLYANSECKWCPASGHCSEQKQKIKDLFQVQVDQPISNLSPIETLESDQIALYLENADILDSWITAIRKRALSMAISGVEIPGYQVTTSIGNRKWSDPPIAERQLSLIFGPEAIYEKKLKSPTQIEKLRGKEFYKASNIETNYVVREETGKKLVKTSQDPTGLLFTEVEG